MRARTMIALVVALAVGCQPADVVYKPTPTPPVAPLPGAVSSFGNVSVGGNLQVAGTSTLSGATNIVGGESLTGTLAVTGGGTFSGTLDVTGVSTLTGGATVSGAGLTVSNGGMAVTGGAVMSGGVTFSSTVNVNGLATLSGGVSAPTITSSGTRITYGGADYITVSSDPSTGGGVAAPVGSWAFDGSASANVWHKTGAGDTAWTLFSSGGGGGGADTFGAINVLAASFGTRCDGSTDDRASIQSALAAACALSPAGAVVNFPAGSCVLSQAGSNPWSLDIPCDNLTIQGVRGKTWLKHKANVATSGTRVEIVHMTKRDRTTFRDIGFDGNWGNASTTVAIASAGATLPQATINVASTSEFPTSGTYVASVASGTTTSVTCTGKTSTSFTGCSGGTGTLPANGFIGLSNSQAGLNQVTDAQNDPHNFGIFIRGSTNTLVDHVAFRQIYGDCVWSGIADVDASTYTDGVTVRDSTCDMAARDGYAIGSGTRNLLIDNFDATRIFAQAFDGEPVGQPARNITVVNSHLGGWWAAGDGSRTANAPVSIQGGAGIATTGQSTAMRNARFEHNRIDGGVVISNAVDVDFSKNRVVASWNGYGTPPIWVNGSADDVNVADNDVYVATQTQAATPSEAILVQWYLAGGNNAYQAVNVRVANNRLHVRNGAIGIKVVGSGGSTTVETGTSTSLTVAVDGSPVTEATLVDSTKNWTANQWVGFFVQTGGVRAIVDANTATTLTLRVLNSDGASTIQPWHDYLGSFALAPSTGAYTIFQDGGIVDVDGNIVEGRDDGRGAGGIGISVSPATDPTNTWWNGTRVRVRNNTVKDVTGAAISVASFAAAPYRLLQLTDNEVFDDQPTPTTTTAVAFTSAPNAQRMILRGNSKGSTVTNATTGLTSGQWLEQDGTCQQWTGYGAPTVAAPVCSTYRRVDGSAGAVFYFKESGTGTTGWSAAASAATPAPDWAQQIGLLGATFDPANQVSGALTFTAGAISASKVRVYATSFSKVLVCVTALETGATHFYVGVYKSDGTQTTDMGTATVDAASSFSSGSTSGGGCYRTITLTNSVAVNYGDDVYIAFLETGSPSPAGTVRASSGLANGTLTAGQGVRQGSVGSSLSAMPGSITLGSMSVSGSVDWVGVQ